MRVTAGALAFLLLSGSAGFVSAAENLTRPQLEEKYRSCFQPESELDNVVTKELELDRLKKVDDVPAGPHKVKQLIKSDPLTTAACMALPPFLKPMCWGRTIGKFADLLLREPTLNKELTRQYVNYLKIEVGRCEEGYTPEDPQSVGILLPSGLGNEIGSAVSAFMRGAGLYCAQILKVEKDLTVLRKDCGPVPDLKGKTYDEAKDYLLTGLPEGERFSSDLMALEEGKPVRYPSSDPAFEKVKNLKVVGQEPAPGVLVDPVTTNLAVQLEPNIPEKLVLTPIGEPVLFSGGSFQVKVEATFTNGEVRDVTSSPDLRWKGIGASLLRIDKGTVTLDKLPDKEGKVSLAAVYSEGKVSLESDALDIEVSKTGKAVSLRLEAAGPATLSPGGSLQVKVEATFASGEVRDVTSSPDLRWEGSDAALLRIGKGTVTLKKPPDKEGKVSLVAVYGEGKISVESNILEIEISKSSMAYSLRLEAQGPTTLAKRKYTVSGQQYAPVVKAILTLPDGTEADVTGSPSTKMSVSPSPNKNSVASYGGIHFTALCWDGGRSFEIVARHSAGGQTFTSNTVKYKIHEDYTIIPCYQRGMKREEYEKLLEQRGLKGTFLMFDDWKIYGDPPPQEEVDKVLETLPNTELIVRKNSNVKVYIVPDIAGKYVKIPDILNMSEIDATQTIQGLDLDLLPFLRPTRFDPNFAPGVVKRQGPAAGEYVPKGTKVVATLNPSPDITIPDLIGKREGEARDIVRPLMLLLDVKTADKWVRGYDAGIVVKQDPKAGSGKPVKPGTTITVWLNPSLPSIGIDVIPNKRSYKIGESISFAEDVDKTNPNNTYTFTWMKDGEFARKDDSFTTTFDTPGIHYVQLILESTDPSENDALIVDIHIDYPPDPTVTIAVSPGGPYTPGTQVTLGAQVTNLPDAVEYRWLVNGKKAGSGKQLPYKLGGKGKYEITLVVVRKNGDELTAKKTIEVGDEPIKPLGRWVNRFEPVGTTANLRVCSSYWKMGFAYLGVGGMKSQKAEWSECTDIDTVGAVDNYDLYTGEQDYGHNTGFLAYIPEGKKKVSYRVYSFNFEMPALFRHQSYRGFTQYGGTIESAGSAVAESIAWSRKSPRAGQLQWLTEEGSQCSAWIYKTQGSSTMGSITQSTFIKGGVQGLTCEDAPPPGPATGGGPGTGTGPTPSSIAQANQIGQQFQGGGSTGSGGSSGGGSQGGQGNLSNVTVSQKNVTITFWDHGQEDGDIINIYLNGKLLKGNISLEKKKRKIDVALNSGSNTFEVEAVNEGTVPPNTASVRISNVTKGRGTQIYKRKSGQRASMNLFAP